MDRGVVLLVSGASTALHVPFILHSFPVISFLIYGNGAEAWPRNRVQQMVIDKLIAKQPHDIWHGNLPQNDRQRERERERKRKRKNEQTNERKKEKRERASSMPNDTAAAGNRAPQAEFLSLVLPVLWVCRTVFAWFTPSLVNYRVWSQVVAFGGALSLYSVSCASLTKDSCNTKVVFNHSDPDSYLYIYIYIYVYTFSYIHIYIYIYF